MRNVKSKEKEEEKLTESDNVISLPRLAYSGGGSEDQPWLLNQELGTVFLARRKAALGGTQDFTFGVFCLLSKSEKGVRLIVGEGVQQQPVWVDPIRFCNQMDFIEKIGQQHFIEAGDDDDTDIRPV